MDRPWPHTCRRNRPSPDDQVVHVAAEVCDSYRMSAHWRVGLGRGLPRVSWMI